MARAPEILHGLGSIVENAIAFAAGRVEIATEWDRREVRVRVADDGPGFDPAILGELGEPYLSRRGGPIHRRRRRTRCRPTGFAGSTFTGCTGSAGATSRKTRAAATCGSPGQAR